MGKTIYATLVMSSLVLFAHGEPPCNHSSFSSGLRYTSVDGSCSEYIQCAPGEHGTINSKHMTCPIGLYWNQRVLSCDRPFNALCPFDPCRHKADSETLTLGGHCSTYITCDRGISKFHCCDPGKYFHQSKQTCISDNRCTTICSAEIKINITACDEFERDKETNHYFYRHVAGRGKLRMRCPTGTAFNTESCLCSDLDPTNVVKELCSPEFSAHFDTARPYDQSKNSYFLNNVDDVNIEDGHAMFDGHKRLLLPGFSNRYWGKSLGITLRLKADNRRSGRSRQTILSNNDGNNPATSSIYLSLSPKDRKPIKLGIETDYYYGHRKLEAQANLNDWVDILVTLSDGVLTLDTGDDIQTMTEVGGNILPTGYAVSIGAGAAGEGDGFVGLIDYVEFYECVPERKQAKV